MDFNYSFSDAPKVENAPSFDPALNVEVTHDPHIIEAFVPGYHMRPIARGVFGEASKITEEHEEFLDALEQSNPLMALIELSDLLGAIDGYLANHHPSMNMGTLLRMSQTTQRAFINGHR